MVELNSQDRNTRSCGTRSAKMRQMGFSLARMDPTRRQFEAMTPERIQPLAFDVWKLQLRKDFAPRDKLLCVPRTLAASRRPSHSVFPFLPEALSLHSV